MAVGNGCRWFLLLVLLTRGHLAKENVTISNIIPTSSVTFVEPSEDSLSQAKPQHKPRDWESLVQMRTHLLQLVDKEKQQVQLNDSLTDEEKDKAVGKMNMKVSQLDTLDQLMDSLFDSFKRAVDYNNTDFDKDDTLKLALSFKLASLQTEGDLKQAKQKQAQETKDKIIREADDGNDVMGKVIKDVAHSADVVEEKMRNSAAFEKGQQTKGATFETVVKIGAETEDEEDKEKAAAAGVVSDKDKVDAANASKSDMDTKDSSRQSLKAGLEQGSGAREVLKGDGAPNGNESPGTAKSANDEPRFAFLRALTNNFGGQDVHQGVKHPQKTRVGSMSTIIDTDNNLYQLSRPNDTTVEYQDWNLLHDIIALLMASFACGMFETPSFFFILFGDAAWIGCTAHLTSY